MANDTAPTPHTEQFREARAAGIPKGEALKSALAGINNKAMRAAMKAACEEVYATRDTVWTAAQLVAHLEASRDEWGDRHADRMAPYLKELHNRMALASAGPIEALVVALHEVETPEVRRDLCAAAAMLLLETVGGESTTTAAPIPAPAFSKKLTSWVKDIGKNVTLLPILGAPPNIALGFAAGRFRGGPAERRAGWCLLDDPMCTDDAAFTRERLQTGAIWCVGWRVDEAKLPGRRLKLEIQVRIREWCVKEGKEKCPKGVQEEIKELLTQQALRERMPETRIYPVIIDTAGGNILAHGVSDKALDEVTKALRHAGWALDVRGAEDVLAEETMAALAATAPDDLRLDVAPTVRDEPVPDILPGHVAREFLLWLWWRASTSNGTGLLNGGEATRAEWWIETPIVLSSPAGPDEKPHTVTIAGSEPENTGAALAALAEGFLPSSLRIGVRVPTRADEVQDGAGNSSTSETRDYHATMEGWGEKSVGLPAVCEVLEVADVQAAVFERLELYREFSAVRDRLFTHWARRRCDSALYGPIRRDIRAWIGLELARKFIVGADGKQMMLFGACQRLIPVRAD